MVPRLCAGRTLPWLAPFPRFVCLHGDSMTTVCPAGSSEYDQISFIVGTLGPPPPAMLCNIRKAFKFFTIDHRRHQWMLKVSLSLSHTHTHTHTNTHTQTHTHTHTQTHIHTQTHKHTYTHKHTHTDTTASKGRVWSGFQGNKEVHL